MKRTNIIILLFYIITFLCVFNLEAQDDDIYYQKNRSKNKKHAKSININKDVYNSRYENEIYENTTNVECDGITLESDTSSIKEKFTNNPISSFHVEKKKNEPVIPRYDSLSNILKDDLHKNKFIELNGQSLYLAYGKDVDLSTVKDYKNVNTKDYVGHYFELLVKTKDYLIEEYYLKDWESGQTYKTTSLGFYPEDNWVIVGYYEKMKQLYLGKNFVSHQYINPNSKLRRVTPIRDYLYSVKTGEKYSPEYHSLWTCVDVSVNTDIEDIYRERTRVVLVLQNEKDELYYCYLKRDDKHTPDALIAGMFYLEDQSKIIISREKQLEEERKNNEELAKKQQAESIAKRRAQLEKLYKKSDVDLILKRRVLIGWTKQMCIEALGKPKDINKTTTQYGTHEQWVYDGAYLYFDNGKLTSVQN